MSYIQTLWKQLLAILIAFILVENIMFVVDERERVVVTRLGNPVKEISTAGLHFKYPWPIEKASFQEKRMFVYDSEPKTIPTKDKKLLVVDLFAILYVKDGTRFLQKLDNMQAAMQRIDTILYSELRDVVGNHDLEEVIGPKRDSFMKDIVDNSTKKLEELGIGIKIARASRTDLPAENKQAIYGRMSAERASIGREKRADGEAEKTRITAEADRQYETIVSEAKAKADRTRGEGDSEATKIYNAAFGKDPEFFRLYRGLEAARLTMGNNEEVRFILDGSEPHLQSLLKSK